MAASDKFSMVIKGRGGHGAMPHLTSDPVIAASYAVIALQPLVSRETDPVDSTVVTVARFSTGKHMHSCEAAHICCHRCAAPCVS